jgi:hypothetical protein
MFGQTNERAISIAGDSGYNNAGKSVSALRT